MGFLDGQKAIRYYDPTKRTIRISRNVAFNENEEPQELKIITELPGLQFEGEKATDNDLPNLINTPETPEHHEHEPDTCPEPEIVLLSHTYPPRSTRWANIDYRTLNNLSARLA